MRILLAEDDAALAQRLQPLLEQAGYVVQAVADGRQAEEIGQIEDLQAAIVDLGLPGLDGLSVIERWRANGRSFPVLVLTARGRWHDKLAGFDAGADDYLTKPFQADAPARPDPPQPWTRQPPPAMRPAAAGRQCRPL